MRPPTQLETAIAEGDFDRVESDWLAQASEDPTQLDYFVRIAQSIAGRGEEGRATELLELLDEQLQERSLWESRLRLIHEAGKLYIRAGKVHATVMGTLKQLYKEHGEELDPLLQVVGLDGGKDAATKLWDKVERLKSLLAFEVGTVVAMKDKGVGQVVEVNLALQTLKVDFERFKGLAVGLRAAGKMLEILPPGHILRRKLEEPELLVKLRDEDPGELLRLTLTSHTKPLSGTEIRAALSGVIETKSWNSWWSSARKHPQVVVSGSSRQSYSWAETTEDAAEVLWQRFEEADARTKIDLLRRSGQRAPALQERMSKALLEIGAREQDGDPALAFEVWAALERLGKAPSEWGPAELIPALDDPVDFLFSLSSRALREQAYLVVREGRRDWLEIFQRAFLRDTDAKALRTVATAIADADAAEFRRLVDQTLTQPRRAPGAFLWLAEEAGEDEELRASRAGRFLRQILVAFGDDTFAPYRSRLEALCDSGATLPKLMAHLEADEASDLEAVLESAVDLQDYHREPLINALHLRFPELRRESESPLYTTPASLDKKREELRTLLEDEIPANRRAIEEARALGDLRENFEYKSARQRHEYLSARASSLHGDLQRARPLDPTQVDPSEARVGTRSTLKGSDGSTRVLTILGPWESHPEAGVISYESDLAAQLLGKRVGDEVEIGEVSFELTRIEPYDSA